MGIIVVVAYKPKPGMEAALLDLTREHVPVLRKEGLATERPPTAMRSADGTIVEVFEWVSHEAIEHAHKNLAVIEMWKRYGVACDIVPLNTLAESSNIFPGFEPIYL